MVKGQRPKKVVPKEEEEDKKDEKKDEESDSDDEDASPVKFRVRRLHKEWMRIEDAKDEYGRETVVFDNTVKVEEPDDEEEEEEKVYFDENGNSLPVDFGRNVWQLTELSDEEEEYIITKDDKNEFNITRITEEESMKRAGYLHYWLKVDKQTNEFKPVRYTKFVKKPVPKPVPTVKPDETNNNNNNNSNNNNNISANNNNNISNNNNNSNNDNNNGSDDENNN